MVETDDEPSRDELRARILEAGARLVAEGGPEAATTRAVAAAAGVQAPTLYRLFGDKRGLLDAIARHALAAYVAEKAASKPHRDPIQDLRRGWDSHVAFGLGHPGVFAIMSGEGAASPAVAAGREVLRRRVRRVASAGRLRVGEDRAVALLQAVGTGVVSTLLASPEGERDRGLSDLAREAVIAALTGEPSSPVGAGVRGAASALRASLDDTAVLSPGERHLLVELLARITDADE